MEPLKTKDNQIKLEVTGVRNEDSSKSITKTHRGHATTIDPNAFDGYLLRSLSFTGVVYTREDAERMAEFFKVHAYCLRKKDGTL